MKKTTSTIVALALASAVAFAQDKPAAPPAPAGDPIIMAAGDITVRQSEFEKAIKALPAEYQQYALGAGRKNFAEDYLRMRMLAAAGVKAGLDKDPAVLEQLSLMRENLIAQAQLDRIDKEIAISEEDLKKAYEAKKNEYEQVSARHILIAFKGSPAAQPGKKELSEEEAKAKAEDLRKQLAGGASFEELAKKESDDTGSGANGGELGSFARGQMVPEFEKAAFEGKIGEISPAIRTQYGFHIIRVDAHETTPFEQVRPTLERTERQARVQAALDQMKAAAKTTFNEKYFAPEVPVAPPAPPAPAPVEKKP
ncbi:MAG: peptidylprolyl isomerase [Thermoanaerobaculia bacterium]